MLAILLPRLLRPAQAAAYLGVGATIFERDIRPNLIAIPMGRGGIAFDRLDLDAWADEHKARTGRPAEKGVPAWDVQERPASLLTPEETGSSTRFTKGRGSTPDSEKLPLLPPKMISGGELRRSKKKRSVEALLAELSVKHASGT